MRFALLLLAGTAALPCASHAQDFCEALEGVRAEVIRAGVVTHSAEKAAVDLERRLALDPESYGEEAEALVGSALAISEALAALDRVDLQILNVYRERCPDLPAE